MIILSAIVREGHLKYKVDKLSDAVWEHHLALIHQAPGQTGYKSEVEQWLKNVEKQIELEQQRLISVKRLHTIRYRNENETDVYKTKYERG